MSTLSITGKPAWIIITVTACIAASADAVAAMVVNQVSAEVVFRFIAGGLFGIKAAFAGDYSMVFIGIAFHFAITLFWTLLYAFIQRRFALKKISLPLIVICYGCVIWLCMNLIVVPASKISTMPTSLPDSLVGLTIIIIAVALPIVYLLRRSRIGLN